MSAVPPTLRGKKIVFVVAWPVMGGAERNMLQVLLHLAHDEGARVDVLALTAEEGRFRDGRTRRRNRLARVSGALVRWQAL